MTRRRDPLLHQLVASAQALARRLAAAERRVAELERVSEARAGSLLLLWRRVEALERRAQRGAAPARPEPQLARVVTIERAAEVLDTSTKHVRRLGRDRELDLVDVRSADAPRPAWRVSVPSIEELLARRRALQSAPVREKAAVFGRAPADARKGG